MHLGPPGLRSVLLSMKSRYTTLLLSALQPSKLEPVSSWLCPPQPPLTYISCFLCLLLSGEQLTIRGCRDSHRPERLQTTYSSASFQAPPQQRAKEFFPLLTSQLASDSLELLAETDPPTFFPWRAAGVPGFWGLGLSLLLPCGAETSRGQCVSTVMS